MERISGDETDLFLLQAGERSRGQKGTAGAGGATERRSLPGFTAWLPDDFVQAGRERAAGIFWSRERPELVFVSRERGAAIAFRVLEESGGDMPERIRAAMARLDGRTVFYNAGREETGAEARWLEYKSFAADGRVYNLLFLFRCGDREILGQYFCPFEEYDRLKPLAWEIMRSVECDGPDRPDPDEAGMGRKPGKKKEVRDAGI